MTTIAFDQATAATEATSETETGARSAHAARTWTGRIASGIAILFLAFDAAVKLANPAFVAEASEKIGIPGYLAPYLGVVLALCVILYAIPRTAPLGAVLLTGYLGGAVLTHLRVDDPLFSHTLFPIYFGGLLWLGLYCRDGRVRNLLRSERT